MVEYKKKKEEPARGLSGQECSLLNYEDLCSNSQNPNNWAQPQAHVKTERGWSLWFADHHTAAGSTRNTFSRKLIM